MSPSFTTKRGVRYPFYVSSALLRGRKSEAGSVPRVSAAEIEAAVITTLRSHMNGDDTQCATPQDLVEIDRLVVKAKSLTIRLKYTGDLGAPIEIPWYPANKSSLVQIGQAEVDSDRVIKPRTRAGCCSCACLAQTASRRLLSQYRRPRARRRSPSKSDPQQNKVGVSGARYHGRNSAGNSATIPYPQ